MLCGYPPFGVNCEKDCGWNQGINCDTCQVCFIKLLDIIFG